MAVEATREKGLKVDAWKVAKTFPANVSWNRTSEISMHLVSKKRNYLTHLKRLKVSLKIRFFLATRIVTRKMI